MFNCLANQFLSSSFVDCNRKSNQSEEIIYLNYKIRRNATPQTLQTAPDYSSAIMLVIIIIYLFQFGFTKIVHKTISYDMTN